MIVRRFLCNNMALQNTLASNQTFSLPRHCKHGFAKHACEQSAMWRSCKFCSPRLRAIRRFLCNDIVSMVLQNTTNTRECTMIVGCFLCNNMASMVLYKTRLRAIRRFLCSDIASMVLYKTRLRAIRRFLCNDIAMFSL